jgi:serine/threonine protein kinase/tetratricopeptide (TPR) repeat protein
MNDEEIFHEALARGCPEERAAYLERACAGNRALRASVEALLRASIGASGFMERGSPVLPVTLEEAMIEGPGTRIGPYKLMEQIGEGGMGLVFVADQLEPVRRRVALKLIKPGMDSRQVIARFEGERQALALMDHPNIAKIFDGGTTASGRPYFVMELVKGVPITDYCDDNRLTTRARLKLFGDVCAAVQHAHQKGIIHRDIKPSNVLVVSHDGTPVVKVIDFGVAKAVGKQLGDKTVYTQFAQMVGTPLYMSPEQAGQSGLDVDTRTDIYALGVLLYELLTGTTPFEKDRLHQAGYDEMRRIIREEEPPKPSTRLSTLGQAGSTVSAQRQSDPKQLCKQVRGELDWIVMKALDKDRNRRYESASALAADVQRYLDDLPVQASPPSAVYRLRKGLRRHKAAAIAACVILLSLVGGIVGTSWGLVKAEDARQAEEKRADGERQAKEEAQAREAETKAVLEFVEKRVFAAARPQGLNGGLGHDVTLRRAIEEALPFIAKSFTSEPLIEARLRQTVGISFLELGEARIAAEQFEAARALYAKHRGPEHPDTLQSMYDLARSIGALGRHTDALKLNEQTLALRKATLGTDHPDTLWSMNNLANGFMSLGRHTDALKLHKETLALRKAKLGPDHPDTLASMQNLANCYQFLGRQTDALKLREETLPLTKAKLGVDHPSTLTCMRNLAVSYCIFDRHKEAFRLDEEALALMKAKLGPDHPGTLASMNNLAIRYLHLGRDANALKLSDETLALVKAKPSVEHSETLESMRSLARTFAFRGRRADALKLSEETLALVKARLGLDNPETLQSMNNLAYNYGDLGRDTDAVKLREEVLPLMKAKLGLDHLDTFYCMINLAGGYVRVGRHATALTLYRKIIDVNPNEQRNYLFHSAARAAALVGCGEGEDVAALSAEERAYSREQALVWLRISLTGYRDLLEKSHGKPNIMVHKEVKHAQADPNFHGVRDAAALTKLPEAERQEWKKLWEEVEQLRKRAVPEEHDFVRLWLILSESVPYEGTEGANALDEKQIPDEELLQPRAGERVEVSGKTLVWKEHHSTEPYIDCEVLYGPRSQRRLAYAVCYVYAEADRGDLVLRVGSEDQAKIYLNGNEIYKQPKARSLELDQNEIRSITLKKGTNVLVFKVVNENGPGPYGSLHFVTKDGRPAEGLRFGLEPE